MNIQDVITEYSVDSKAIEEFSEDLYVTMFAENFTDVRNLYNRMKSSIHPITDEELEYILTTFPMELFIVAENLNKLRLQYEVVKLKNKEKLEYLRSTINSEVASLELTKAEKQDYILHRINAEMIQYDILTAAYSSVITRVENEQSFSRELIMGAKKIWDSRRSSEAANPVEPVVPDLPEYKRNQYVK